MSSFGIMSSLIYLISHNDNVTEMETLAFIAPVILIFHFLVYMFLSKINLFSSSSEATKKKTKENTSSTKT